MKIAHVAGRNIVYTDDVEATVRLHFGVRHRLKILFGWPAIVRVRVYFNDYHEPIAYEAAVSLKEKKPDV